jgi:hypothetical protein
LANETWRAWFAEWPEYVQSQVKGTRPMRMFILLAAILTLLVRPLFARDDISKTYQCAAKDAVDVQIDGTISGLVGKSFLKKYDKMVVDLKTGHVTYPVTGIREERVVQQTGVFNNEYVLVPSFIFHRNKTVANAAFDFIRVRTATADQPQTIFMVFSLSHLVTGTCEIVQ